MLPPQKIIFKVLHVEYHVKNSAHVYRCIVCCKNILQKHGQKHTYQGRSINCICSVLSFQKSSSAFHAIKLIVVFQKETKSLIFKYVFCATFQREKGLQSFNLGFHGRINEMTFHPEHSSSPNYRFKKISVLEEAESGQTAYPKVTLDFCF